VLCRKVSPFSELPAASFDKDDFIACPDESVDYAVMEQTDAAVVVPLDAGWRTEFFQFLQITFGAEHKHPAVPVIFTGSQIILSKDDFIACPDESVDYAVMEQTDAAVVVPLDAGWSDVNIRTEFFQFLQITFGAEHKHPAVPVIFTGSQIIPCPDESVDYAVMEQTDAAVVVPLDAGWSDVGSWSHGGRHPEYQDGIFPVPADNVWRGT
jgi:mannose-1-phosphate guanylyltransferase